VAPGDPTRGSAPRGPQRRSVLGGGGTPPSYTPAPRQAARPAPGTRATSGPAQGGRRAAGSTGGTRARSGGGRGGKRAPSGKRRLVDYPRQGKTGFRRWLPSWRLVGGTFLFFLLLVVGAFVWMYQSTQIPDPSDFAEFQTTTIYYADGTTEMGRFAEQNRTIIPSEQIPEHVKQAVVAAEDRSFYENPGINPTGILRALYLNLTGKDSQGGSSITQQYAERYYHDRTITDIPGKVREAFLAVKLARTQDKDTILANYMNTIYWGRDSYGIEAASRAYFGIPASELNVSQGALLAGVIPSPNNFDPRVSPEQAERRWNYVLDGMVTTGALTQAERDAQVFPETVPFTRSDRYAGPTGYLLDMVRRELVAEGFTEEELDQRGYRITTTIDHGMQAAAVEEVANIPPDHSPNLRVALVTLEPGTGAIRALYGGPDYLTQARNAVTQDNMQAGSTFKPFTLVAYLENGGSLKSRYNGNSFVVIPGFSDEPLRNFGRGNGQSWGEIDVVRATANSVNTVYAQMNVEVGPAATLDVARRAGVCTSWARADEDCTVFEGQEVPANVLGTASPHPLDMAQAYNTFAAQGVRTEPFIVAQVVTPDGEVVHTGGVEGERVFAEDVMADTTYALSQVVEQGSGTKARAVGHPVAGKTGTSQNNRSAWFIGYTTQLTTAVAMYQVGVDEEGRAVEEEITPFGPYVGSQITGGSAPLDLWTAYMTRAMAGREVQQFPPRADVGTPNRPPVAAVPDVVGMPEADAIATLQQAGFTPAVQQGNDPTVAPGLVARQDPPGGTEIEQGSTVTIVVSTGPGTAPVPDVVGQSLEDARAALQNAGFQVAVEERADDDTPPGRVIEQRPSGTAPPGSTVTIVVSTGPGDDDGGDGDGGDGDGGDGDGGGGGEGGG